MVVIGLLRLGILVCILSDTQCAKDPPLQATYNVSDDAGLGRRFDGIGGLSGGGPNFGASLHILKVEIGGDDQSTDGTESSHMHEEWDENYNRGYEWWLMKEAKKRNPDIKLWGLSWAWPGWIGGGDQSPYNNLTRTALYIVKWIQGAKTRHNLDIDYVGIWNERYCDIDYLLQLRKTLDQNKLQRVSVVPCDTYTNDLYWMMQNSTITNASYAFGVHYPGTIVPQEAIDMGYSVWSSEDYSTYNDDTGAGCWARILNQNYVNGYMTSTTSWNLIASYYRGLPYEYDGLMNAVEPWSGYYEAKNPIWITAHTSQFAQIGYRYLQHGHGVGLLKYGGSYVSLISKDRKNLTMVIETLSHDHSVCIRPDLPPYTVQRQKATFKFGGTFTQLTQLHLWRSQFNFQDPSKNVVFHYEGKVKVSRNRFTLDLEIDSVYTLTTSEGGQKGDFGTIPRSAPFPLPYSDDFEKYQLNEEPYFLTPQIGVWEIYRDSNSNQFARQVIQTQPVSWCQQTPHTTAVIGDATWSDVSITAKVRVPSVNGTSRVFLALRVTSTGCDTESANGVFFWLTPNSQNYSITSDLRGSKIIGSGSLPGNDQIQYDKWYNVSVTAKGKTYSATLDGVPITQMQLDDTVAGYTGFAAVGTGGWGYADYDNLTLN